MESPAFDQQGRHQEVEGDLGAKAIHEITPIVTVRRSTTHSTAARLDFTWWIGTSACVRYRSDSSRSSKSPRSRCSAIGRPQALDPATTGTGASRAACAGTRRPAELAPPRSRTSTAKQGHPRRVQQPAAQQPEEQSVRRRSYPPRGPDVQNGDERSPDLIATISDIIAMPMVNSPPPPIPTMSRLTRRTS